MRSSLKSVTVDRDRDHDRGRDLDRDRAREGSRAGELDRLDLERELETFVLLSRGMAHDVHGLLAALLLTTQTLRREQEASTRQPGEGRPGEGQPGEDQLREDLHAIHQCAAQAVHLLDRFVQIVNNEREEPAEIDLSALLRDLQPILKAVVDRRAKLEYALADELPRVSGDATHLRRVVLNLVLNAAEACAGRGARIRVKSGAAELEHIELARLHPGAELREGRYAFIEVEDDGPGMDTATQRRMFDVDFTTKANGKGLGLAILRRLVTQHRGAVGVTSALGRGTKIRVYLPAL